ncbi:MAG TPA: branched-chain amino acid ABC transporter permease, partial [Candidatus Nanopelagicales bacterium]|nr:branched-chain amino acid ABC transporter permease [Candidatus Nanopelagicales bacterium]
MTAPAATAEAPPARSLAGASSQALVQLAIVAVALVVAFVVLGPAQFVNALTLGAIYALVAIGYTMVYGIIELINFAHGDMFMVGSFVSLSLLVSLGFTGAVRDPLLLVGLLVAVFLVTMVVMGLVGVLIERAAYRPLRTAPRLAPLITAIGVSFILQNLVQFAYGPFQTNSPQVFPTDAFIQIGDARIPILSFFIVIVAVGLMIGLQLFIGRTR